jgi:hypothetical protein
MEGILESRKKVGVVLSRFVVCYMECEEEEEREHKIETRNHEKRINSQ